MAITSSCASLLNGQSSVCVAPQRRYYQQVVLINRADIDPDTIVKTFTDYDSENPTCEYNVSFSLKQGKTGYRFMGSEAGSSFSGTFDASRSDFGFPQFIHNVNMVIMGASEEAKCILDSLVKGSVVAALQFADGTVEIYGIDSGLVAQDFTFDVQGGGGGSAITLSSLEIAPENNLPLIYKSVPAGSEGEDFDDNFANIPAT